MYNTIEDIKTANKKAGKYFFSSGSMRFFNSRVSQTVYPTEGGAYFVTSEKGPDEIRRYSVRYCGEGGDIVTVGDFQAYASGSGARKAAARYAEKHEDAY